MGTAAPAFKKTGNEDFIVFENFAADRAYPVTVSFETVDTSADVHETIFAAVQGGEGQGADQLPVFQFG